MNDVIDVPAQYHFCANWRGHVISLVTERSRPAHEVLSGLASAIVLGQLDPVCQKIESIVDCALDFRVHSSASQAAVIAPVNLHQSDIVIEFHGGDGAPVNVRLPGNVWPQLSRCSALELFQATVWKSVASVVRLARFQLGVDDTARLAVGSLVLLPESFETTWPMSVYVHDIAHAHNMLYERTSRTLTPVSSPQLNASENDGNSQLEVSSRVNDKTRVEVHLQKPVLIDPLLLLRRTGTEDWSSTVLPRLPALQQSLCTVSINGSSRFEGSLVVVGEGNGVYLSARSVH